MAAFIKKQQFNYIKKCLSDLNNAFRNCVDSNIVETTKIIAQDKILAFFDNLSEEEKEVAFAIRKVMYKDGNIENITENLINMLSKTKNNKEFIEVFPKKESFKK